LLTNHAYVLLCVAREPDVRIRTVAQCAGITERAAQRILSELVEAGYLIKHRLGRRNFYEVQPHMPLRRPLDCEHQIGEILRVLLDRRGQEGGQVPQAEDEHEDGKEPDAQME
jgi:hypothetical protein